MRRLTKILIAVGIAVVLVAVLVLTLVIVLRKEEWIVLEKSFSSLNDHCTQDWSGNSDWRRRRCKMPLICAPANDQKTGYCRLPWSEGEGKSCAASVHLCSTGLTCDPYLKICRRLISVGGSCTEQNAFMCESGICGYAATQTAQGEPLGGRHSLSRYCIVKDLPPGAACDRFRHCVTDCLQCVQGICKPVPSPLDHQQMLLEQQKELMLPLAVNGFSAENQQTEVAAADTQQQVTRNLQRTRGAMVAAVGNEAAQDRDSMSKRQQLAASAAASSNANRVLDEQAVRQAWEQRAAEASALLGETVTAEDLASFFSVPRNESGEPLEPQEALEKEHNETHAENEEGITGQQALWGPRSQYQALQHPAAGRGTIIDRPQPRPLLNGSLAKRLARLFTGVSYAFTPEDQQQQMSLMHTLGAPAFGFPSALPPQLSHSLAPSPITTGGIKPPLSQHDVFGTSSFGSPAAGTPSLSLQQQEQLSAQLQQLQQLQQPQPFTSFDSSLEAMEAAGMKGEAARRERGSSEEEGEALEGLVYPGMQNPLLNPLQLLGFQPRQPTGPLPPPLGASPALNMQRQPMPPRLPGVVPPPLGHVSPGPLPPLSSVPLGASALGGTLPPLPLHPKVQTQLLPSVPYAPNVGPLNGLPSRLPTDFKGGCWLDRCCASHHYCSFLHASQGCQARKREGATCVGDSARECEDRLSCVNGECSPWFTSRHASAGDPIVLTDNVDLDSVCAPWQRFEYSTSGHSSHLPGGMPPQLALPSPLETPNPYGNNLGRDIVRTFRKFSGRCVPLDKRSCVTDRECWGVGGFGFCDVRSKRCRTPSYPACLSILKDLYSCLWHEGRLRETTDEYIVTHVPRTPQFILHEAPASVNHVQSKCIPSVVRAKRAEFVKCVHEQGFTLERIVYVPDEWFQG